MSHFSSMILLVASLMLTAFFGVAAWRTSDDGSYISVSIPPASSQMRLVTPLHSRGVFRPSFDHLSRPKNQEGAGNAGCLLHPRSRVQ